MVVGSLQDVVDDEIQDEEAGDVDAVLDVDVGEILVAGESQAGDVAGLRNAESDGEILSVADDGMQNDAVDGSEVGGREKVVVDVMQVAAAGLLVVAGLAVAVGLRQASKTLRPGSSLKKDYLDRSHSFLTKMVRKGSH